uniref:Uncharacterized protein n=1 Tax=Globodera rostochiensis TaxID=31243 RepID=A0A914ID08_GLORO
MMNTSSQHRHSDQAVISPDRVLEDEINVLECGRILRFIHFTYLLFVTVPLVGSERLKRLWRGQKINHKEEDKWDAPVAQLEELPADWVEDVAYINWTRYMAKFQFIAAVLLILHFIVMTSGRVIRNDQRNASRSRSPMFGWSAMFSPMTDVQNQKFEMDKPKQIGANANSLTKMASNEVEEEEEPLVFSSYNRDCFFTPVNCFVGRAGQQASKIIGTAYNSKRQILFIRRMPKIMN